MPLSGGRQEARFESTSRTVQLRFRLAYYTWSQHASIRFVQATLPDESEIRVRFSGVGQSFSRIGRQAELYDRRLATMQLGVRTDPAFPEDSLRAVVLHEFGHALGLIHEHQSPSSTILWDTTAVYSAFPRWSKDDVLLQVLNTYNASTTQYSSFDSLSVMIYPIPASLTRGKMAIGWNSNLSLIDKRYIRCWYPQNTSNVCADTILHTLPSP